MSGTITCFNYMKRMCCSGSNFMSNLTFSFNLEGNISGADSQRVWTPQARVLKWSILNLIERNSLAFHLDY